MVSEVTITTGSRLHFGFLAHKPVEGRQYGGIGMMLDSPGVRICCARSEQDQFIGPANSTARVRKLVQSYRQGCPTDRTPRPCRISVERDIPRHRGLGSGTQLALSVAQGLAFLAGDGQVDVLTLAGRVRRGRRSAIGVHGFARGGLLLESGKTDRDPLGTLVSRVNFPTDWRFVLITPSSNSGLAGHAELNALESLSGMPKETTARLCELAVMRIIPAAIASDYEDFSTSLSKYGRLVGEYFAPVQGGLFAHPRMQELAKRLHSKGFACVVQSSWGPTVTVFSRHDREAEHASDLCREFFGQEECDIQIAKPMNHGAVIEFW